MECTRCGRAAQLACDSCKTPYCGEACQKAAWPTHRAKCIAASGTRKSPPDLTIAESALVGDRFQTKKFKIGASDNLTIINDIFQDIRAPQPFYILSFGPPGSGKSTVLGKILSDLEIPTATLVKILIDDFVEKYPGYRSAVAALQGAWKAKNITTEEYIDASEDAYWFYRTNGGTAVEESVKLTAFRERYNIIKETTGQKYGSTVDKVEEAKKNNYRSMLVYPFVSSQQLVERIRKRAEETGRFPDPAKLAAQVKSAQKTFLQVYDQFDIVLIIDNDKVMSQSGVLAKINKTSAPIADKRNATCDATRMREFIRSGDMIVEFAEFITRNCS